MRRTLRSGCEWELRTRNQASVKACMETFLPERQAGGGDGICGEYFNNYFAHMGSNHIQ